MIKFLIFFVEIDEKKYFEITVSINLLISIILITNIFLENTFLLMSGFCYLVNSFISANAFY